MFCYPKAAVERAMKIQEVILRAMAKKITGWQAAEILGFSDRHLRRIRERYQQFGYESMFDKRRSQPSPKPVPCATVEKVLGLYREQYFDLNVRHFHEKLHAQHGVDLSYTWVKLALQGRWWRGGGSAECIASGAHGGRCRGCCCTATARITAGFRTNAGMTGSSSWTTPPARSTTRNCSRRNLLASSTLAMPCSRNP
jgi:hypothetical protein